MTVTEEALDLVREHVKRLANTYDSEVTLNGYDEAGNIIWTVTEEPDEPADEEVTGMTGDDRLRAAQDVDAAKHRVERALKTVYMSSDGEYVGVQERMRKDDVRIISAELDRLRKQVVAFEQAAPRLYRCNDESCYLCDADMRYLFPGIDVAALRGKEG